MWRRLTCICWLVHCLTLLWGVSIGPPFIDGGVPLPSHTAVSQMDDTGPWFFNQLTNWTTQSIYGLQVAARYCLETLLRGGTRRIRFHTSTPFDHPPLARCFLERSETPFIDGSAPIPSHTAVRCGCRHDAKDVDFTRHI